MKNTFPTIIYIILIVLITSVSTILTALGGLRDKRNKKLFHLTIRGFWVVGLYILILIVLVCQEVNTNNINYNNSLLLKSEQNKRDSITADGIKSGVDSSYNTLFEKLSMAFADQNLKIDTIQDKLVIIKDSIKTSIINNNVGDDPILLIDSIGFSPNKSKPEYYDISFTSKDAGSTNFVIEVRLYITQLII